MKPLFTNTTKYTKQNYEQFIEFHRKKFNFSYMAYTLVMSLLIIYCMIFNITQKNFLYMLLFLILLIIFLVIRLYIPVRRYKKTKKNYSQKKELKFKFAFYPYYFTIGKKTIYYFKLFKVFETANCFYLYVDEDYAAILNKDSFEVGTADEFSKFIKKKCLFRYSKQS